MTGKLRQKLADFMILVISGEVQRIDVRHGERLAAAGERDRGRPVGVSLVVRIR